MNAKQIAEIARLSKSCRADGYGRIVRVWPDGSASLATNENDVVARGKPGGDWEYPIASLRRPMSRREVADHLAGNTPRYSVRPIAGPECDALNPVDEEIFASDDLTAAEAAASKADSPYGAGIEDRRTGLVDYGLGFGVDASS